MINVLHSIGYGIIATLLTSVVIAVLPPHGDDWRNLEAKKKDELHKACVVLSLLIGLSTFFISL